jgi:mono/diheme cytochrome c family protein
MQLAKMMPVIALLAAVSLAACGGGGGKKHSASLLKGGATAAPSPMLTAMKPKSTLGKPAAGVGNGAAIFSANCSSCHQANGKGVTGTFPPLANNSTVTGPSAKVITIVKNGLTGPVTIAGTTYNGAMPAWKGKLTDAEIAQVISFIRTAWGNHAAPVTVAQVKATK